MRFETPIQFVPMPTWPYPSTEHRRSRSTFKASWTSTMALLDRELQMLDASSVLIGGLFTEHDVRRDGMLRSNARQPIHPGIEISFDSGVRDRRLVFRTDSCDFWQHNVRSIALGMEALRAVDRFGITGSGEQYAGFLEIEAGSSASEPTIAKGRALIELHGDVRRALQVTQGGDPVEFQSVMLARDWLSAGVR